MIQPYYSDDPPPAKRGSQQCPSVAWLQALNDGERVIDDRNGIWTAVTVHNSEIGDVRLFVSGFNVMSPATLAASSLRFERYHSGFQPVDVTAPLSEFVALCVLKGS